MWFLFQVIIMGTGYLHYSSAFKYRFTIENEEIFTPCSDQPKNVLDINGFFDMSEIHIEIVGDALVVSGNLTSAWNIEPSDRIQFSIELHRFERGSWAKTLYGFFIPSACGLLYDKNQYWYQYWSKHVINIEDVRSKCFSPGTKLVHETFSVDMMFDYSGPFQEGRHKLAFEARAFNAEQQERDTRICFEILGEMSRA